MRVLLLLTVFAFAASVPQIPEQYVLKGFYRLPYFNMSEPFTYVYDSNANRQKWSFFDGTDITYYFYNQNRVFHIGPNVDHLECTAGTPDGSDFPTLTSVIPNLQNDGWALQGQKVVNGVNCNWWYRTVTQFNHTDKYSFYFDQDGTPVQLYMDGINYLFGSHQDIYVFDFVSFSTKIASDAFNLPSICQQKIKLNGGLISLNGQKTRPVLDQRQLGSRVFQSFSGEGRYRMQFNSFVKKHSRKYASAGEEYKRYLIFKKNLQFIEDHNSKNAQFKLKMNHFGDLSDEEFRLRMLRDNKKTPRPTSRASHVHVASLGKQLPEKIDWRAEGAVTMVKDQASCGSCWTFGTTGSLEGAYYVVNKELISLSEQQLVDCSRTKYGNAGCGGGFASGAFQWIIDNGGIALESSYPYLGQDGFCNALDKSSGVTISGYVNVSAFSEAALHDAVANIGPVAVAIDAAHPTFRFYASGVYYEPTCKSDLDSLDHEVLAVGYGYLTAPGKDDYWIVKNSWSTHWGDDGYILMARNRDNNCGIASQATYPIVPSK